MTRLCQTGKTHRWSLHSQTSRWAPKRPSEAELLPVCWCSSFFLPPFRPMIGLCSFKQEGDEEKFQMRVKNRPAPVFSSCLFTGWLSMNANFTAEELRKSSEHPKIFFWKLFFGNFLLEGNCLEVWCLGAKSAAQSCGSMMMSMKACVKGARQIGFRLRPWRRFTAPEHPGSDEVIATQEAQTKMKLEGRPNPEVCLTARGDGWSQCG